MERFKNVKVHRHEVINDVDQTTFFQSHPMKFKMATNMKKIVVHEDRSMTDCGTAANEQLYLCVDETLMDILCSFRTDEEPGRKKMFPLATISNGNSEFADGYVVFLGVLKHPHGKVERCFFVIMIQAKDCGPNSPLKFAEIEKNVERCRSAMLDPVFGPNKNRLMCVASRKSHLDPEGTISIARDFVGYHVDDSKFLSELLPDLYDQRAKETTTAVNAYYVEGGVQRMLRSLNPFGGSK